MYIKVIKLLFTKTFWGGGLPMRGLGSMELFYYVYSNEVDKSAKFNL